jgi:hypothetical protein
MSASDMLDRIDLSGIQPSVNRTLDDIADDVRIHLSGAVENIIRAGQALQEGRDMHLSDKAFHEWCMKEFPDLDRTTRHHMMKIGNRFSGVDYSKHRYTVLRELAAPSVPDELVEEVLSLDRPVKVTEVQEAKKGYKEVQEDPDYVDLLEDVKDTRKTPTEAAKEALIRSEKKREAISNTVSPDVIDLGAIARNKEGTDIRSVGPAFIVLMEKLCTKFDERDIKRELYAFMEPDPLGLKKEAMHKMSDILSDLCLDFPLNELKNLN